MESGARSRKSDSGWAAFAGVMMFMVGSLDALWGLGGILNDNVVVVGGHGAIVADITTWGWVHLILGILVALTGLGLLMGNEAARWLGIFFVARERDLADRLVPSGAPVGVPADRPRRDHPLPADRPLGQSGGLGLTEAALRLPGLANA